MPLERGVTPRESIAEECERRGRSEVVSGCMKLLAGGTVDDGLIVALAAGAARPILDERAGGRTGYWPRVWAARGLLHVWDERATRSIVRAALDESWRVREKVAQVVAAHHVDAALSAVVKLRDDPIPRVRIAAERAIVRLTDGRHAIPDEGGHDRQRGRDRSGRDGAAE